MITVLWPTIRPRERATRPTIDSARIRKSFTVKAGSREACPVMGPGGPEIDDTHGHTRHHEPRRAACARGSHRSRRLKGRDGEPCSPSARPLRCSKVLRPRVIEPSAACPINRFTASRLVKLVLIRIISGSPSRGRPMVCGEVIVAIDSARISEKLHREVVEP